MSKFPVAEMTRRREGGQGEEGAERDHACLVAGVVKEREDHNESSMAATNDWHRLSAARQLKAVIHDGESFLSRLHINRNVVKSPLPTTTAARTTRTAARRLLLFPLDESCRLRLGERIAARYNGDYLASRD